MDRQGRQWNDHPASVGRGVAGTDWLGSQNAELKFVPNSEKWKDQKWQQAFDH